MCRWRHSNTSVHRKYFSCRSQSEEMAKTFLFVISENWQKGWRGVGQECSFIKTSKLNIPLVSITICTHNLYSTDLDLRLAMLPNPRLLSPITVLVMCIMPQYTEKFTCIKDLYFRLFSSKDVPYSKFVPNINSTSQRLRSRSAYLTNTREKFLLSSAKDIRISFGSHCWPSLHISK